MTDTSTPPTIRTMLKQRFQIAVIWGIEDVQEMRPDLNDGQSWEVLQQCDNEHDRNSGITWDSLARIADEMFPYADTGAAEE